MKGIRLPFYICLALALTVEAWAVAQIFPNWAAELPFPMPATPAGPEFLPRFFLTHWAAVLLFGIAFLFAQAGRSSSTSFGLFLLFVGLAALLPVAGPALAFLMLAVIEAPGTRHRTGPDHLISNPKRTEWIERTDPGTVIEPLVCEMRTLDRQQVMRMILGLRQAPPRRAEPFLRQLRQDRDAQLQILAQSVSGSMMEELEGRVTRLRRHLEQHPDHARVQVELGAALLAVAHSRLFTRREQDALVTEALTHLAAAKELQLSTGERARATDLQLTARADLGDHDAAEALLRELGKNPAAGHRIATAKRRLAFLRRDWGTLAESYRAEATSSSRDDEGRRAFWRGDPPPARELGEQTA